MSFVAQETSLEAGHPVELYSFLLGTTPFRYTSSEVEAVSGGLTYTPEAIQRDAIVIGGSEQANGIEVTLPSSNELARKFIGIVPGQSLNLTVSRFHRTDGSLEVNQIFEGLVKSIGFTLNGAVSTMSLKPLSHALGNELPRKVYSIQCGHVLYDAECKVNENAPEFKFSSAVVSAIDGFNVTITDLFDASDRPNGWFTGGFIRFGGVDFRTVRGHTGDVLTLDAPFPTDLLSVGNTVDVFAGCSRQLTGGGCDDKFDNTQNYGGFAWIPVENLFERGLV